ncbi:MAG: hypothetical protein DMG05_29685 [Acidobacteria bacterium]|nr:MAG: hypothetical protein DMG05_29685 [Acidobacteriota bacterium]
MSREPEIREILLLQSGFDFLEKTGPKFVQNSEDGIEATRFFSEWEINNVKGCQRNNTGAQPEAKLG